MEESTSETQEWTGSKKKKNKKKKHMSLSHYQAAIISLNLSFILLCHKLRYNDDEDIFSSVTSLRNLSAYEEFDEIQIYSLSAPYYCYMDCLSFEKLGLLARSG